MRTSIDLEGANAVWLHAVNTNLAVVANDRWEDDALAWVAQRLHPGDLSGELIFWGLPRQPCPQTRFIHERMNKTTASPVYS